MKSLIAFALIAAFPLQAQELLPELVPHVTKFRSEMRELMEKRRTTLESSRKTYLEALAEADAAATSAGNVVALAVITKEKASVETGALPAEVPKDLPRTLQAPRKAYLTSLSRTSADFTARQKKIDSDYLRILGTLQTKANANPALGEQIAKQKKLLLNPAARVLEIRVATYQGVKGQNPKDVTTKLRELLEEGAPSLQCSPGTLGVDPAPFQAKCLDLEYVVGGVAQKKRFADGETVVFKDLLK